MCSNSTLIELQLRLNEISCWRGGCPTNLSGCALFQAECCSAVAVPTTAWLTPNKNDPSTSVIAVYMSP